MKKRIVKKPEQTGNLYKKILQILSKNEKFKFLIILIMSLITGFTQSISVASFLPFMSLLQDIDSIYKNKYLSMAYNLFHFTNTNKFVIFLGIGVALLILVGNAFALLTSWIKNRFILFTSHNISKRLLTTYLYKNYQFILGRNSADLAKNILNDVFDLTNGFLSALIDLIINLVMILFIMALLLTVDIKVTLIIISFFIISYGTLVVFTRSKLRVTGKKALEASSDKFKYTHEALNSYKISKTMGIEPFLIHRFEKASKRHAKYRLYARTLQEIPKYFMDALIFSGMTAFIVILIIRGENISNIIPTITVYAVAGYRIMPELAKLFGSFSSIAHSRPILERLEFDIDYKNEIAINNQKPIGNFTFSESIELRNVRFHYGRSDEIIKGINLLVKKGTVVGFAGTTGAGKTTLIDIFLGLLVPQSGGLFVDGLLINEQNIREWRSVIGYVPQDIYLIDDTIKANIAFGIAEKEIDEEKIKQVAKIASISEFIETELPDQYLTEVGERGVRLSGGQRQRIGLARALYRNPEVLILDEATSALDGATEEHVVRMIHTESNVNTIIIIAHRLNTLKPCHQINIMEAGEIIEQGNYDYLINNSLKFRQMAKINSEISGNQL